MNGNWEKLYSHLNHTSKEKNKYTSVWNEISIFACWSLLVTCSDQITIPKQQWLYYVKTHLACSFDKFFHGFHNDSHFAVRYEEYHQVTSRTDTMTADTVNNRYPREHYRHSRSSQSESKWSSDSHEVPPRAYIEGLERARTCVRLFERMMESFGRENGEEGESVPLNARSVSHGPVGKPGLFLESTWSALSFVSIHTESKFLGWHVTKNYDWLEMTAQIFLSIWESSKKFWVSSDFKMTCTD